MKLNITAIKIQMASRGLSGYDLAVLAHIAPGTMYSAMKRQQASTKIIGKLAKALDVHVKDIIILEEETASSSL